MYGVFLTHKQHQLEALLQCLVPHRMSGVLQQQQQCVPVSHADLSLVHTYWCKLAETTNPPTTADVTLIPSTLSTQNVDECSTVRRTFYCCRRTQV